MPDHSGDTVIDEQMRKLRAAFDEIEVLLEEHDAGECEDYSAFQCKAEELLEAAAKITDRDDELLAQFYDREERIALDEAEGDDGDAGTWSDA